MENKNHTNNAFGNGFMLGLLIGVIVTLLVTTKKGRELFKEITEKGLDKFSDLEQRLQETTTDIAEAGEEFEEMEDGDDYVPEVKLSERSDDDREHAHVHHDEKNGHSHKPHPVRRFFKKKS